MSRSPERSRSSDRVAIVTGGGRAMGAEISRRLADDGFGVYVWDLDVVLDSPDAEWMATAPGVRAMSVDVASEERIQDAVQTIISETGRVDCLVNNAAISPKQENGYRVSPTETSTEEWDLVMGVNLRGPFLATRAVLPSMIASGWGRVVNISSSSGRQGARIAGLPYGVAKTGINGLTRTLALEVGKHGITVNSVAPGRIATPMSARSAPEVQEASRARIPVGREGHVSDVAGLVSYLCSDEAGFVTGATIDINGGAFMAP
ncbi:SDR family NAD(P)-dependent oxidoreductase [Ruicaihuangia caeni]|uniref:SDR family NAD(P)-dependent oxidoreductase n=1 Tax=Ruicaihuangia caeni TaxID=3042517 RepID=A0AAW6T6K3_9MICO|nr:SDR family NAD(P)-dependent oxidoreductase [Klugiella sp. YN-L-19]MDI2098701.1 SDR family NAD(P)-dependent oxidoreductase [Klugiella sp. YN-L-19]